MRVTLILLHQTATQMAHWSARTAISGELPPPTVTAGEDPQRSAAVRALVRSWPSDPAQTDQIRRGVPVRWPFCKRALSLLLNEPAVHPFSKIFAVWPRI